MHKINIISLIFFLLSFHISTHEGWEATKYPPEQAHAPSPLPDRVVLTGEDNPATTQSVTWRTDISTKKGKALLAVANANGRALETELIEAETTYFKSDINESNYHSITFRDLKPDTI